MIGEKVDQNVTFGNFSKIQNFLSLHPVEIVCLVSLIKSPFFVLSDALVTSLEEQSTHPSEQRQEKGNGISPNPRAQSRTFKNQARNYL